MFLAIFGFWLASYQAINYVVNSGLKANNQLRSQPIASVRQKHFSGFLLWCFHCQSLYVITTPANAVMVIELTDGLFLSLSCTVCVVPGARYAVHFGDEKNPTTPPNSTVAISEPFNIKSAYTRVPARTSPQTTLLQ